MDVDAESSTQGSHPTGMVNGHVEDNSHKTAGDKQKSKLRLTYDEYESMARHLTTTLRIAENRAGDGKLSPYILSAQTIGTPILECECRSLGKSKITVKVLLTGTLLCRQLYLWSTEYFCILVSIHFQ